MTRTAQPLAVRAINGAGGLAERVGLKTRLDEQSLVDAARRATGLDDLGPETYREGLRRLVASLEGDAALTTIGRVAARRRITNLLETRLRLIDHRTRHPGVTEQRIRRPIFVLGLPRTGTTVLYGMLAADPAMRAPSSWEVARPFPPPRAEQREHDARIAKTDKEFDGFRRIAPGLDRIHPLGARLPQECLALQAPEFASYEFPTTFPVTGYWEWLREHDMRPAYEFERWFLQHLQSGHGGADWILKTPAHLMWLDALLAVFDDALLVHTHRDPAAVLGSVASLMVAFRSAMSHTVDPRAVGREQLEAWTWGLDRAVAVRDRLSADRVVDIHYTDTVNDPIGTVQRIYDHFGITMTSQIGARVSAYLEDNPRNKHGAHHYSLAEFGLQAGEVDAAFASYRERFEISKDAAR